MQYADSDGPDQSVYLHSQIMASGTRLIKTHNTENYKDAERMHWSDCANAQADIRFRCFTYDIKDLLLLCASNDFQLQQSKMVHIAYANNGNPDKSAQLYILVGA